jgi:hypothetical protein
LPYHYLTKEKNGKKAKNTLGDMNDLGSEENMTLVNMQDRK